MIVYELLSTSAFKLPWPTLILMHSISPGSHCRGILTANSDMWGYIHFKYCWITKAIAPLGHGKLFCTICYVIISANRQTSSTDTYLLQNTPREQQKREQSRQITMTEAAVARFIKSAERIKVKKIFLFLSFFSNHFASLEESCCNIRHFFSFWKIPPLI